MAATGLLALRLAIGAVLAAHGSHVLFGLWSGDDIGPGGLSNAAIRMTNLGFEPGFLVAVLTGVIQLAGGSLVAVGWLTRWAAAAALGRVLIDVWFLYAPAGFFLNWTNHPVEGHGVEYALLLSGGLICLLLVGAGDASFDAWRSRRNGRSSVRGRVSRRP